MRISNEEKLLILFPFVPLVDTCKYRKFIENGKFNDVIEDFIHKCFHQDKTFCENVHTAASFSQYLETFIKCQALNAWHQFNFSTLDVLSFGVSCLYRFIECNLIGPFESSNDDMMLKYFLKEDQLSENLKEIQKDLIDYLSDGDELISYSTKQPLLLLLSKIIFSSTSDLQSSQWWTMRSLYIHQLVLEGPSPSIHKQLTHIVEKLEGLISSINDDQLSVIFYLEKIQIHLHLYSEVSKVETSMNAIRSRLRLQEVNLLGRLGKRTRFQHCDIAQLTLQVKVGSETTSNSCESTSDVTDRLSSVPSVFDNLNFRCSNFPKDQLLHDETRLPEIQFADKLDEHPALNVVQLAAILALFILMKKSEPKDELLSEKLSAYLTFLLSNPKVWNIQVTALRIRSLIEAEASRTVERSITQIQSLIADSEATSPPLVDRLPLVFCSFTVPKWELETNLAKLLVEVGAIQSALDIYNHLQMWEEMVACYNHLKLRHKAAEVIRTEMAKKETVLLWCLLGDAIDDVNCYQNAWEMSGCKSSRAQKHLALYYFNRKKYEESIPHFQKSLELNSLQVSLWFNFGYAALVQEEWELSANAYRRYTYLQPDCFEAWNNLAKSYVKLGRKDRAWRALQEAVKCNYDNWKVWDNLMAVSTDCGDFHEVIRCYHRILDIKGKHIDLEVLRILINGIKNNSVECDMPMLKKDTLQLMGRLTSKVMNDHELWKLYAVLIECSEPDSVNNQEKVIQCLQKSQRLASQEPGWERTVDQCKNIIDLSLKLSTAQKRCSSQVPVQQAIQYLNSAKLMLRGISSQINRVHTDVLGVLNEELSVEVQKLDNGLGNIESMLQLYTNKLT